MVIDIFELANFLPAPTQEEKIIKFLEVKKSLERLPAVNFKLPDGSYVPQHFHVTEVGLITKNFIDCGGVERKRRL